MAFNTNSSNASTSSAAAATYKKADYFINGNMQDDEGSNSKFGVFTLYKDTAVHAQALEYIYADPSTDEALQIEANTLTLEQLTNDRTRDVICSLTFNIRSSASTASSKAVFTFRKG